MTNTTHDIDIIVDHATSFALLPKDHMIQQWAYSVLKKYHQKAELTIRLVDKEESASLNQQFRKKPGPTNILTFCFETPSGITSPILGDIVLCPSLMAEEVLIQPPPLQVLTAHWAHLVVHGCLHLLGYDHHNETSAGQMEPLEIELLRELGYPNPYE